VKHLIYTEKSNISFEKYEPNNDCSCSINCCSRSIDNGICSTSDSTTSVGMGRLRWLRRRLWWLRRRLWWLRRRLWWLRLGRLWWLRLGRLWWLRLGRLCYSSLLRLLRRIRGLRLRRSVWRLWRWFPLKEEK
jgi:hypothetical protein